MNNDLNQAVAFAQKLHSAIVMVEKQVEPIETGIEVMFGAITGIWPRQALNGAVPIQRNDVMTADYLAAEIQKASDAARAGLGRTVSCELVSDGPICQAIESTLGDISSARTTTGCTVGIGFATEGAVGIGPLALTGQIAGGLYFNNGHAGFYGCIGGSGLTLTKAGVGLGWAGGVEITFIFDGGIEAFSGASIVVSIMGGVGFGGGLNVILSTDFEFRGFSVIFPFGDGFAAALQMGYTWTSR